MDTILQDYYFPSTDSSSFELMTEKEGLRPGVIMKVRGAIGITETENRNGRVYTNEFWDKVLGRDDVQGAIKERALVGAADHPIDKFVPPLSTVSHVMTRAWVDKDKKSLMAESEVLDTPMGRVVATLLRADVKLGASTRGGGSTVTKEGKNFVSEKGYKWGGFDFVFEPSAQNAYPKPVREQIEKIICESSPDSFKEDPAYFKAVLDKLGCNGNLIMERVKQAEANLNENNESATDKNALLVEEQKKEIMALRKKVKSLEDSLTIKETNLSVSNTQISELQQKVSVLVESFSVNPDPVVSDSVNEDLNNLGTLYDVLKQENDVLFADVREAINLARAKKAQVVIESRAFDTLEKELQVARAKILQYGIKLSSLTESNDLLSKRVDELTDGNEFFREERKKLISEKASLYSRLTLVLRENEIIDDEAEAVLEQESMLEQELESISKTVPKSIEKQKRPPVFEGSSSSVVGGLSVITESIETAQRKSRGDTVCDLIRKI